MCLFSLISDLGVGGKSAAAFTALVSAGFLSVVGEDVEFEAGYCESDRFADLEHCCLDAEIVFAYFEFGSVDVDGERHDISTANGHTVKEIYNIGERSFFGAFCRDGFQGVDFEGVSLNYVDNSVFLCAS